MDVDVLTYKEKLDPILTKLIRPANFDGAGWVEGDLKRLAQAVGFLGVDPNPVTVILQLNEVAQKKELRKKLSDDERLLELAAIEAQKDAQNVEHQDAPPPPPEDDDSLPPPPPERGLTRHSESAQAPAPPGFLSNAVCYRFSAWGAGVFG
jgi:hypothetical protein